MIQVHKQHAKDPNFPIEIIMKIEEFLGSYIRVPALLTPYSNELEANEDIFENPEKHDSMIHQMKIQAALITNNSPYAEVRAVVDNHDDPTMPVSTIRAWVMGTFFSCCISFINSFF